MSSLSDKLLQRVLAGAGLVSAALEYDVNMAPVLRIFGRQVGPGAVFHGATAGRDLWLGPGARIGRGVRLGPKVRVGAGATIRAGAALAGSVQIGDGCNVGERARLENVSLGSGSTVEYEVLSLGLGAGHIVIGRQSYIGVRNVLDWSDTVVIGDFVHVAGPSTAIWTHSSVEQALHGDHLDDKSRRITRPVRIGDRAYIGGNCTIYPGVSIGDGSVVLPNSAVNADIEPGVLAGGVPARVIRRIGSEA